MAQISINESLLHRNDINTILKHMATDDEKWVTYENIKRNWTWEKRSALAQTVAKLGLTASKGLLLCV